MRQIKKKNFFYKKQIFFVQNLGKKLKNSQSYLFISIVALLASKMLSADRDYIVGEVACFLQRRLKAVKGQKLILEMRADFYNFNHRRSLFQYFRKIQTYRSATIIILWIGPFKLKLTGSACMSNRVVKQNKQFLTVYVYKNYSWGMPN
jgi:hypothetical protein